MASLSLDTMCQARGLLSACAVLLLSLRLGVCQRDCTGVDCPQLDNCIEEALESGACCASCLQKGCTCEGYQYYDCINAGFKNGKVPQGDSYFVDYGSTECSCPAGGGRISCHFISCPDMPPNCIEISEPVDGCMQCERVGCVRDGQKYEAGHSVHVDPCQVCHCPNEGGNLMCYPVPNCDTQKVDKSVLAGPTEENPASRRGTFPYGVLQNPQTDQSSTEFHPLAEGNLPLFKSSPLQTEEPDDYDYDPTHFPETFPQSLVLPTVSSSPSSSSPYPLNDVVSLYRESVNRTSELQSPSRQGKQELRERYGVQDYPTGSVEVAQDMERSTAGPRPRIDAPQQSGSLMDKTIDGDSKNSTQGRETLGSVIFPLIKATQSHENPEDLPVNVEKDDAPLGSTETQTQNPSSIPTPNASSAPFDVDHPVTKTDTQTGQQKASAHTLFPLHVLEPTPPPVRLQTGFTGQKEGLNVYVMEEEEEEEEEAATSEPVTGQRGNHQPDRVPHNQRGHEEETSTSLLGTSQYHTTPAVLFTSVQTSSGAEPGESQPVETSGNRLDNFDGSNEEERVNEEETEEDSERRPAFSIKPQEGPGVGGEDLVPSCCTAGQAWAARHHHCDHMAPPDLDTPSVCSVVREQCCLVSLKETRCESGALSARRGDACHVAGEDSCAGDAHQVCCSCCALGLRLRAEGRGCDSHQYLGYPCGHVFLTCCEEDERLSEVTLRRKERPRPTSRPKEVSDSKFPKEAFSIDATDEAANAVEEQGGGGGCRPYGAQLCQHTCSDAWGSYRCGCHRGYVLQPDGHSCAPVDPDEDNRVRQVDRPAPGSVWTSRPTAGPPWTTSPRPPTRTTARVDPCSEKSGCGQRCTAAAGRARCSCFPGFRLKSDGRTCEDVDECLTGPQRCGPGERCVNTLGSFVCELRLSCPAGYRRRNGVCEDVDECALSRHSCGVGTVCENTLGSFLCSTKHKCMSGFTQDPHGNCVDINECSGPSDPCSAGSTCVNTVGSYTCQKKSVACSHGYHAGPDGAKCVDIDECLMGTHRCGGGQICRNLPGTHRCDCQTGYQHDGVQKACVDVNECWRYPGRLCAQTCENTPGSYHCSCTTGFSLAVDGKNCEDVNECEKKPCSQECANIYGSYQCYCRQGYYLTEDGHTCEDIDECSQSISNLCAFQCVNVAGSYQCSCPPQGYVMSANGRTCTDVDECATETHNCSVAETCYNLRGAFRCLSFDCPHNYRKVSDTRCERSSCPLNSGDCQNSPVRITFYQLSFQTNIVIPAQIFRIGPSPAYSGDQIAVSVVKGNQEGYFSTRKLNSFTGAVYLQRQVRQPRDFLIDVEMKLLRQGSLTSFLARIYVFITSSTM